MNNFQTQYQKLNSEQKLAVDTIEGPVMVIAGPGTGKTQTLALRIANILLKTQVDPRNILCLTFTENAALEMLNRLKSFIGPDAYKVKIYTFHAFCEYLMSSNLEKFPQIAENNENIDESDRYEIILEILKSLPVKDPLRNIKKEGQYLKNVSDAISSLKKEGVSPEKLELIIEKEKKYLESTAKYYKEFIDIRSNKITSIDQEKLIVGLQTSADPGNIYTKGVLELISEYGEGNNTQLKAGIKSIFDRLNDESYFPRLKSLKTVYERYQDELTKRNLHDFEDMIMFVLNRLVQDQDFLSSVQEEFHYILVDEYQDTNAAQNEIIQIVGSFYDNPNIFVVGDDDQSIFRFQGANLENILQFSRNYQDSLKIVTLKTNYRSQPYILKASRNIIESAENRLEDEFPDVDKDLTPNRKAITKKVDLSVYKTEDSEVIEIAKKIKTLLKTGTNPGEIAIILTANKDMDLFAEIFTKEEIPFQVSKSGNVVDNEHIKNILVILEYLSNPHREDLLSRILYMPYFGFDNLDVFKIANFAYYKRLKVYQVLTMDSLLAEAEVRNTEVFKEFMRTVSDWHREIKTMHPAQFFPFIIKEAKILEYLTAQKDNYLQLNNFHVLYDFLKKHLRSNPKFDFEKLVAKIDLISEYNLGILSRTEVVETSKVNILTVHKSKGLEFKHVFIPKLLSNKWEKPQAKSGLKLPRSINTQDYVTNEQDERIRLFFVALTRAKDNVHLSYPQIGDNGRETKPSWFISLISSDLIDEKNYALSEAEHKQQLFTVLEGSPDKDFSDEGRLFLNKALENFSLSPTSFNSYRKCPHCFFLTSIVCIPRAMSLSLAYGNTVHKALNLYLSKYRRTQNLPDLEFLINSYLSELSKQFLDSTQIEALSEQGKHSLETFYSKNVDSMKPTSLTETNLGAYKINIDGVPIKGKIDRIDFVEDALDVVELVDYKTGVANSANVSVKGKGDYYVQLLFYKLLIDNYPKYNWSVKSGKIIYVDPDSAGRSQKDKEFTLPDEDVDWLKLELKKTYQSIMNLEFNRKDEKDCYNKELHDIKFSF